MPRSHRGQRFIRPTPKTKMWIGNGTGFITLVNNANTLVSSLTAAALLLRPFTILRTHAVAFLATDQVVASEAPAGAYGELVVTDAASAAGIASIPDVLLNPEADWFVYQPMVTSFIFGSGIGFTRDGDMWTVDSKSMRKVGPDDDVVTVAKVAGGGADLFIRGRTLIQLH